MKEEEPPERPPAVSPERLALWRERRDKSSERVRQTVQRLSLAGFAAIWILRGDLQPPGVRLLPPALAAAAFFLILALSLDLFLSLYSSWVAFHAEAALTGGHQVARWEARVARALNRLTIGNYLFAGEVVSMVTAYAVLLREAARALTG
jgi:hypothetical protein